MTTETTPQPTKLAFRVQCSALDKDGYFGCPYLHVIEAEIDEQIEDESTTFFWAPYAWIPGDLPASCPECGVTYDLWESNELENRVMSILDSIREQLAPAWRDSHKHLPLGPNDLAWNVKTNLPYIKLGDLDVVPD